MEGQKTALVTGAASGIGAAIAERFLSSGYQVAFFDVDARAARATASRITSAARKLVLEGDVSNEQQVKEAVSRTVADLGSLDVLINNAGIEINGTVVDLSGEQWERQLAVNLRGVFLFSKYSIPEMRRRGGSIINISSVHCPGVMATLRRVRRNQICAHRTDSGYGGRPWRRWDSCECNLSGLNRDALTGAMVRDRRNYQGRGVEVLSTRPNR
jgi:NAD(P)-dependent dehydrogenase (short-subunit alcohol dehydrogenase family)